MFRDVLKQLRKRENMTQGDLAKALNISRSTIAMYETDIRNPDHDMMLKISKLFNVSMDFLYERDTPEVPQLSEGEQLLLDMFRQIPEEQQKVFLEMGRVYANSLKKD